MAASGEMPLTAEERDSIHRALETTHSILAGYRDLAYKITIANTTLLVAICYFAATRPPDAAPKLWLPTSAWVAFITVLVAGPILWWLLRLRTSFKKHARFARNLWDQCGVPWLKQQREEDKDSDEDGASMWWPVILYVALSTVLAATWVVLVRC